SNFPARPRESGDPVLWQKTWMPAFAGMSGVWGGAGRKCTLRRTPVDHELYRYSPLPLRPRFAWPNGACVAFHVSLHIEHWELTPPPGSVKDARFLSEFGPYEPDYRTWTQREYGNRVGIFRVLELLDRHAIRASVAIGASACERYPALVAEVT